MIFRRYPVLTFLILALGCASTGTNAEKRQVLPPARLVRLASMDVTRPANRAPLVVDITYEIVIQPDGSPDFNTLQVIGKGAYEIRSALQEWISASRFEPSTVNGVPVRSIFKGGLRSSVRAM